jgi:hypothetical protein
MGTGFNKAKRAKNGPKSINSETFKELNVLSG